MTPTLERPVHHRLDLEDPKEELHHHVIVLREYAKWRLLRGYVFPPSRESHRIDLVQQFFRIGAEVRLTERDLVLILYRGLLDLPSSPVK